MLEFYKEFKTIKQILYKKIKQKIQTTKLKIYIYKD